MAILSTLTHTINTYLPEPHASLLNGILYGEQLSKDMPFYEAVHKVGLLHMVVISGINITLLGGFVFACTRWMGRKLSLIVTLITILLFVLLVGADPPITRAAIMGSIALIGKLYGRKSYTLYTLFLSAAFIALVKWDWIVSVSFQLSFFATFGIILCAKKADTVKIDQKESRSLLHGLKEYIGSELYTSLSAQIFTLPILFWKFREISLIAPFSNIAVSFIVAPVMVVGCITSILGSVHPILGIPTAYIAYGMLHYLVSVIRTLAALPFIFFQFHG